MRLRSLVTSTVVLLVTVVSGSLQCEPAPATAAESHGRGVYGLMCAVCHGADREGYKADQAPALGQQDFLASVTPAFLTAAITDGRAGTTMSAWGKAHGGPLSPVDVEGLVAFLRSWQEEPSALPDTRPLAGDVTRGQAAYDRECARCHGLHGTAGTYERIGNPQLLSTASDAFLRHAIRRGRPGTAMPGFRATLGDDAIDDVIALLRSWEKTPPSPPPKRQPPARMPPLPLGPVPLNPKGPEPASFVPSPAFTSADVVKAQLDRGAKMAILDARAPSDYANDHITGAVSVPFYDPDGYMNDLPKHAWLVCYCGCPHAESGQLARKLMAKGFTKVTVINEGLGYWSQKKYGTTQGVLP